MSSEFNHNLAPITLDNYEEYFVLYIDGELSPAQMQSVEEWLVTRPDLKAELDVLLSTKLPEEEFSFDKESLFAHHMPQGSLQEDLLLFIDNELSEDKKKLVNFELASNESYQQQYNQLLAAKLDANEHIPHPNKQELYRYEKRVVFFRPWMQAAAVVLLVAGMGGFYWRTQNVVDLPADEPVAIVKTPAVQAPQTKSPSTKITSPAEKGQPSVAVTRPSRTTPANQLSKSTGSSPREPKEVQPQVPKNLVAQNNLPKAIDALEAETQSTTASMQRTIAVNETADRKPVLTTPLAMDQKKIVTSAIPVAYNSATPDEQMDASGNDDRKGSLKGFFRKASRLIGRKTGLSSDKEDEVLVGAVSLTLK